MISERPAFLPGEHFRINRKAGKRWLYTALRTIRLQLDVHLDETVSFRDRNGIEWMRLTPTAHGKTCMAIREGYSWNGANCAPDFCLFLETLVHDVFYQFLRTQHFPFSRRECDNAFLDLMKLRRFGLRYLYWQGVIKLGWAFKTENGEWSKIITVSTPAGSPP